MEPWCRKRHNAKAIIAGAAIMIGTVASEANTSLGPSRKSPMPMADSGASVVDISDAALRECIVEVLGEREDEHITQREMATLRWVDCDFRGVAQLSGIEYAENLQVLNVHGNQISDLTSLTHLISLEILQLEENHITDLAPLAGLTGLRRLVLGENWVLDLAPLAGLRLLRELSLQSSNISDLTPLRHLTDLTFLALTANGVSDLTPLAGLTALEHLSLNGNQISDISALVSNPGIDEGDLLWLQKNALSHEAVSVDIPKLVERGVDVSFDSPDPLPDGAAIVEFPDPALERAVRRHLRRGEGWPIPASEVAELQQLLVAGLGIEDLTGLEFATGIWSLELSNNDVVDLAPLAGLTSLESMRLSGNPVSDLSPIVDLPYLWALVLDNTGIDDLAPLAGMRRLGKLALDGNALRDISALENSGLTTLSLSGNEISRIDVLATMRSLEWLSLDGNEISSLEPLAGLSNLEHLNINDNQVADLTPLAGHHALEELLAMNNSVGDLSPLQSERLAIVGLQGNPLDGDALSSARALRESGATVLLGHVVPYFPAAGAGREGFVRVINRGGEGGDVFMEAVDDAGARTGPVRFPIGPRRAMHLNSGDLERGNAAKGLPIGLGPPTTGDWRLEFNSPLDVEVLSYIRTDDGFVTAMHDVAADATLPFFNPGANASQRSILRVVNTQAGPAKLQIGGADDAGVRRFTPTAVLVRPGHAFTATAQTLEGEHGLGDGAGKWRLRVPQWPWLAMSLLESPTGHLTNLSTAPANVERLANGMARHRLPLFLAAGAPRESFARVVNRSAEAGEVDIEGIDDAGNVLGPVRLAVSGRGTVHFNSRDLENGNPAKGLSGGLGTGRGDWRLALTTALDIQVLAYVRTADGFVTAMHDVAPKAEDGGHRVVFFNPGGNTAQVSKLRLVNNGDATARATITGIDDGGSPSGTVALTLARRGALTLTAAQLEAGVEGISGRLGDGTGKWRLHVYADGPLAVMSLLESPTGHLTNLSTATAKVERNPWPMSGGVRPAPQLARERP